jgi:ketosteroid isomerase-like protein|tara:strand:- start:3786 stop:4280 length:495 start_codon:yes stop_codon:yes gene_type:complete
MQKTKEIPMKQSIIVLSLALLVNCVEVDISSADGDFKAEYQKAICDKYSMYANTMDVVGSLSLYAEDAIVNGNGLAPIQGLDKIKQDFIDWYGSSESINHSAEVISAQLFGDRAFAYGKWKVKRTSKEGVTTEREGHWSTHNIKVGGSWKMTLDHTNDLKNYNQ